MAERAKTKAASKQAAPVTEVDVRVRGDALSISVGRWGPYTAADGKVRIPVDAIPAFRDNGYTIVGNDLGRAYAAERQAKQDRLAGIVDDIDLTIEPPPESSTPPLDVHILAEQADLLNVREREEN